MNLPNSAVTAKNCSVQTAAGYAARFDFPLGRIPLGLSSTASLHDEDQTLSWIDDSVIKPSESPATMKDVADAITNGTATTWPLIGLQVLNGFTGETAGQAWLKFEAANNKAARKQAADMAEHSLPPINGRGRGGRRNSADAAKMMSSSSGQK
ncbi:hypothetical protein CEUSTIGMA_g13340.t1 [Chlamydomonas eustigma]|uniref:Uncharacterized protein n=1 Tax=Chlamydomonas eustigma TaxID=1157962 RepID=A0A250XS91_9CHLO|nr:hypothetical protein CEUSTIGMA_g13340.t1 [Chlamydomonas eustigma]|eukprot:GAX85924.1 hypothetical protein CEUSTIGMA_g13340.t1 [Chlamydomonas eustigma]